MADKPRHASEYKSEQVELVRAMCLYVATKLGDMMDDLLVVGDLVPSLIVDRSSSARTWTRTSGPWISTSDFRSRC
jgi:hypothetical protein